MTTTNEVPSFVFNDFDFSGNELTQEQFDALDKRGGKFFGPGVYNLEVTKAEFHINKDTGKPFAAKDPTWLNVKVTFSDGEKEKMAFLAVPTSKILYNENESKRPTWAFNKFREFMAGLGETVQSDAGSLKAIVPKYFKDPRALVGKKMTIEMGYSKPHVAFIEKDVFKVCDKAGKGLLDDQTFASKELAQAAAIEAGLGDISKNYVEILSYVKQEKPASKKDDSKYGF